MPTEQRLIAISTPLPEGQLILHQAKFSETLGQPFVLEVELVSPDENLAFNKILGQNVTLRYETGQQSRFINGLVTAFKQHENLQKNGYYTATVRPWIWLLSLSQHCRIYQQKSYPEIIKSVFDEMGFSDYQDKLRGQYPAQEYVVQFNESDFDFVSRIMQQEGIYYYFAHTNGKHTLILTDDSVTLEDVGSVSYFELDDEQQHLGVEGITQWQNQQHLRTGGISLASFDFITPTKNLDAASKDPQVDAVANYQKYSYTGKYLERDAGQHYSKVLMELENTEYETKSLAGNQRTLFAGARFKLTGHAREDQNIQYTLTQFQCTLRAEQSAKDASQPAFAFEAQAISAKLNFRPALSIRKPQMRGPQTATVVGKAGEDVWTDKYGRIKIRFHWDRQGKADDSCSCWIRVAQSMAGKNWGSISIPRVGQEVLVDFLHGDPDQPIVIGCVYNGASLPPYELPAHALKSGFKSRSGGGVSFNEIRLDDGKDQEQLFIHAGKNMDTAVLGSSYETVGEDKHLTVKQDLFAKVESSRHEDVSKDHIEQIGGDFNLRIGGKEAKEVAASSSFSVQEDRAEQVGGNASLVVTKDYYLKATNICLEASSNITLQVGSSFISMDSGGISIKSNGKLEVISGGNLTVSGGGKADIVAGAAVSISGGTVKIN